MINRRHWYKYFFHNKATKDCLTVRDRKMPLQNNQKAGFINQSSNQPYSHFQQTQCSIQTEFIINTDNYTSRIITTINWIHWSLVTICGDACPLSSVNAEACFTSWPNAQDKIGKLVNEHVYSPNSRKTDRTEYIQRSKIH